MVSTRLVLYPDCISCAIAWHSFGPYFFGEKFGVKDYGQKLLTLSIKTQRGFVVIPGSHQPLTFGRGDICSSALSLPEYDITAHQSQLVTILLLARGWGVGPGRGLGCSLCSCKLSRGQAPSLVNKNSPRDKGVMQLYSAYLRGTTPWVLSPAPPLPTQL